MKDITKKLRKLRIRKGDVIIAHYSLMEQMRKLQVPGLEHRVPIIFTGNVKDIRTIKKENLQKVLDDMKKASA